MDTMTEDTMPLPTPPQQTEAGLPGATSPAEIMGYIIVGLVVLDLIKKV